MGSILSYSLFRFFRKAEARILMVGADAAGKTTILYKLKLNEFVTTVPTIGFNVEKIEHGKLNFTIWDVGGQDKIRPLWRYYYDNIQALIFVVDSADRDRIDEVSEDFKHMMNEEQLRNVTVLVLANKQDLPNAMTAGEIRNKLGLDYLKGRKWLIQTACAITGQGVYEGLDWLSKNIETRHC